VPDGERAKRGQQDICNEIEAIFYTVFVNCVRIQEGGLTNCFVFLVPHVAGSTTRTHTTQVCTPRLYSYNIYLTLLLLLPKPYLQGRLKFPNPVTCSTLVLRCKGI
jgi:hypothetical protein